MDPMLKKLRIIALVSLPVLRMAAQTGAGSIQGTVHDATGAVLPAAKATLIHRDTARPYTTSSNEVGFYMFPSLQPGAYQLSVQAPGMETWTGSLTLEAGQNAVVNPGLKVGAAAAEITVAGDVTPLVTTSSPTLGNAIERERIEQLPLDGRFLHTLVLMTNPGVETEDEASGLQDSGVRPRVFGLNRGPMEFVQDGAVLGNRDTGIISERPPGIDTVQEIKVETNTSSARMNRPATAIIATRGGTNQLHGALFETARNNGLGVARRREDYYDKPPQLVRNEFGASLGGPVRLPRIYDGKNRTFFFFAWEAYRLVSGPTTGASMPTMAMREGDFSGLIDGAGRPYTIYDPWSTGSAPTWQRVPYANNVIPLRLRSPVAKQLYEVTPAPMFADRNPLLTQDYFGPSTNNRRDHTSSLRSDHRFGANDQVFGRYSRGQSYRLRRMSSNSNAPVLLDNFGNIDGAPQSNRSAVLSWTHVFSPRFFSETLLNGMKDDTDFSVSVTPPEDLAGKMGLPNPLGALGLPDFTSTGFDMIYRGIKPRRNINNIVMADQNFTLIAGRHELQFGGRFRNERLDVLPDQSYAQGQLQFNSLATALYNTASGNAYNALARTGHDSANFFLGAARMYQVVKRRGWYHFRTRECAGYFQNNFKVNSRLTLNLGARLEFLPPVLERDNLLTGFDPKTKSVVNGAPLERMYQLGVTSPAIVSMFQGLGVKFTTPREAGLPDRFVNVNLPDFRPRVGFAWRLGDGKQTFVLRGGYGTYSLQIPLRGGNARMSTNPPTTATYTRDVNSAAQSPDGMSNYGLRSAPAILAGVNSRNAIDLNNPAAVTRGSFVVSWYDPHQPTSMAHQWNLTLEREVWSHTVARAGYVGTHGSNIDQYYNINSAPNNYVWFATTGLPLPTGEYSGVARRVFDQTTYGNLYVYGKEGWSNYNAVQLELRRRYTRGYGYQVFYVMGNSFRAGGVVSASSGDEIPGVNEFLPGAVPQDLHERNRMINYRRDASLPKHSLRWNWIADLPFGRGQRFLGHAGGLLDRLVGGWQLAGFGNVRSRWWVLPTANYGPLGEIEIYGKQYPIQDCRSGTCLNGYLWYNGYIPANRINSYDAQGRPNGVMGVPANYRPAHQPMFPTPATPIPGDPNAAYYDTDSVFVTMKNGTVQRVEYDPNLHPWRFHVRPGPRAWGLDASLFKRVSLTERFALRFNMDFFNVLNMPGLTLPNASTGILSLQNSGSAARQMQLTLRLIW